MNSFSFIQTVATAVGRLAGLGGSGNGGRWASLLSATLLVFLSTGAYGNDICWPGAIETGSATVTSYQSANFTGTIFYPGGEIDTAGGEWPDILYYCFQYGPTTDYGSQIYTDQQPSPIYVSTPMTAEVTGLTGATTYHYRLAVLNDVGNFIYSDDQTFTTPNPPPVATTNAPTGVTYQSATLNATISPSGLATTWYFQYGTSTNYGSATTTQAIASSAASAPFSVTLPALNAETAYHYQIVAVNSSGTTYGVDQTFTTSNPPPVASTGATSGIVFNGATLNGTVNPNGLTSTVYFSYGTDASYGITTAIQTANGTSATPFSTAINSLSPATTYHYQIVAANSSGTTFGLDQTFTTPNNPPPTVNDGAATGITYQNSTLIGTVNPNGLATTLYFQYGTTASYGITTGSLNAGNGISAVPFSAPVAGLSGATLYHYQIVAANASGTTYGSDQTFMTIDPPPVVTTGLVTGTVYNGATLNGTVNPSGLPTTVYFQYGTDTTYGITTGSQNGGNGSSAAPFNATIGGLNAVTLYHYQIVAANSSGTAYGSDQTFTTPLNPPPAAATGAAAGITYQSSTLTATVNPNGLATTLYFRYGTDATYGATTGTQNAGYGGSAASFSATITGLNATTLYHYQVVAANSSGTTSGGDQTFTTANLPPVAITGTATGTAYNATTLNGTVDANGLTTMAHFEYGLTNSYGSQTLPETAGSGTDTVNVSGSVTGLTAATLYHYRLVASNSGYTTYGDDQTVTTILPPIMALSGSLAFGDTKTDMGATAALLISNTGNMPLTVSGIVYPTGFSGPDWSGTIAAGQTQSVTVAFSPTATIAYEGTISVSSNTVGGTSAIAVSGTGATDGTATRTLPALGYIPGTAMTVTIDVGNMENTSSYTVTETVPSGWVVSNINLSGALSPRGNVIEWGPFFDNDTRLLSYQVTPPSGLTSIAQFSGSASFDGYGAPIQGNSIVSPAPIHPADVNGDMTISIDEMTAYGAAWKSNASWPIVPSPIDQNYVTRAGYLWKNGESYSYDSTQAPPLCWVIQTQPVITPNLVKEPSLARTSLAELAAAATTGSSASTVTRSMPVTYAAGTPVQIYLNVVSGTATLNYAIEDAPPSGWTVSNISDSGVWDATTGKVKWGPFFDNNSRDLSYSATAPAGTSGAQEFTATASFDGTEIPIQGWSAIYSTAPAAPVLAASLTATGTATFPFSYQISDGNTPALYSATGLPDGLSLSSSTGIISGTVQNTGTTQVTLTGSNPSGGATSELTIVIRQPVPVISSTLTETGAYKVPFTYQITATNGPVKFGATGLPAGLSINAAKGIISGTPRASGTFNVTLDALNGGGTGDAALQLTINPPPPVIDGKLAAAGIAGVSFQYQITATNHPTSFGAGGLPTGLTVNGTNGLISGTPLAGGTTSVTLSAGNAGGAAATKTLTLKILPAVPSFTVDADSVEAGSVTATITAQAGASSLGGKAWIQYGLTASYGSKTTAMTLPPSETGTSFSVQLIGLAPHTAYHYRIVGTNSSGTGDTTDQSFRTFPKSNLSYDGCADLLLTDTTTGVVSFVTQLTGSSTIENTGLVLSASLTWCGLADLTNSGTQQAILFNTSSRQMQFWELSAATGTVNVIAVNIGPTIPNGFMPVAVADMTGNGKPDLVVVNTATRQVGFWTFSGGRITAKTVGPTLSVGYNIVAVDDFTGDAKPDLLLWNPTNGGTEIKVLNGTALKSTLTGSTIPSGWELIGADDFNGTGTAEWLLFNPTTYETRVWSVDKTGNQASVFGGRTLPVNDTPLEAK